MTKIVSKDIKKKKGWYGIEIEDTSVEGLLAEVFDETNETDGCTIMTRDKIFGEIVAEALQKVYRSKENLENELMKRKLPVGDTFGGLGGVGGLGGFKIT